MKRKQTREFLETNINQNINTCFSLFTPGKKNRKNAIQGKIVNKDTKEQLILYENLKGEKQLLDPENSQHLFVYRIIAEKFIFVFCWLHRKILLWITVNLNKQLLCNATMSNRLFWIICWNRKRISSWWRSRPLVLQHNNDWPRVANAFVSSLAGFTASSYI